LSYFEVKEEGVFYRGHKRIFFQDLFSYDKARGAIDEVPFEEIVFDEAIPVDLDFLLREQHDFRDLVKSVKRVNNDLKVTFMSNAYSWSAWVLDAFEKNLFN
jgi:hypothetical protein